MKLSEKIKQDPILNAVHSKILHKRLREVIEAVERLEEENLHLHDALKEWEEISKRRRSIV